MLTIRFERLALHDGDRVLDVGAGFGRHAFEAARRGADVVALDLGGRELATIRDTFAAMRAAGEIGSDRQTAALRGDATRLPFADGAFDVVLTSEVLEHVQDDIAALREMVRVIRPGGTFSCTAPSEWPEKVNWWLSDEYHAPKCAGGHVRIYSATELRAKLKAAGLAVRASHRAHALHSPYWWMRCAVGVTREDHKLVSAYRRFLEWDIVSAPRATRLAERALNPVLGKSLVLYATKVGAS